jgi:hypothetical protein
MKVVRTNLEKGNIVISALPSGAKNLAVLVGNGVSIAHNQDLTVQKLTSDLIHEFTKLSGLATGAVTPRNDAAKALGELSESVSTSNLSPDKNFEQLLSPLEDVNDALRSLQGAAGLYRTVDPKIVDQLTSVATFCSYVRSLGLSHVLQLVDQRAKGGGRAGVIVDFVDDLVEASDGGRLLVGTLNYDHLIDSVMLDKYAVQHSDLASGLRSIRVSLRFDGAGSQVPAYELRPEFDYTLGDGWCWEGKKRIVTLHLHGSLSLLRDTESGEVYRFRMQDLRNANYWNLYRQGGARFEPVVVLTNQKRKSSLVHSEPFNRAYAGFSFGLLSSKRWLIAGYSFQDECVNEVLRDVWEVRKSDPPKILVSTYGFQLGISDIYKILGADNANRRAKVDRSTDIHRAGLGNLARSTEWQAWLS